MPSCTFAALTLVSTKVLVLGNVAVRLRSKPRVQLNCLTVQFAGEVTRLNGVLTRNSHIRVIGPICALQFLSY